MGCATFEVEGVRVRGFVCGRGINPKRKKCKFCGGHSEVLCDWPTECLKKVLPVDLKAGDRIVPFSDGRDIRQIVSIERTRNGDGFVIVWEWRGEAQPPYVMSSVRPIKKAVPGTCDNPCCFRHHRSVGEDVDYCQEHWQEQDAVLSGADLRGQQAVDVRRFYRQAGRER